MAEWPAAPNLIGKRIVRLDGLLKASGKAMYPSDIRPEGTLFGVMLYSPHAHAKITSIDITPAENMPGGEPLVSEARCWLSVTGISGPTTIVPAISLRSFSNKFATSLRARD